MAAEICSSTIVAELFFGKLEKRPQNQITCKLYTFYKLYWFEKSGRGVPLNSLSSKKSFLIFVVKMKFSYLTCFLPTQVKKVHMFLLNKVKNLSNFWSNGAQI